MSDNKQKLRDLNVIVAGQGGDGSLTVVNVLADILRGAGLRVYTERDVLSRIKGGITAATLRAYDGERLCISSDIDLFVAFDQAAIGKYAFRLNERSTVIYDSSNGEISSDNLLPENVRLIGVPLSRYAVKHFRRDIYKNSISKKNWINSKDNKIFLSGDWALGKSLSDAWDAGEKLSHYIKILSV